jgi:hypothetical protein
MGDWLRQVLYPLLVVSIIGSLWLLGTIRNMEEDANSVLPPDREVARLVQLADAAGEEDEY